MKKLILPVMLAVSLITTPLAFSADAQGKIIAYEIVTYKSPQSVVSYQIDTSTIVNKVIEMIKDGWQPLGGVGSGIAPYGACVLTQAMVKYEECD